jgi:hypothetical protein
MQPIAMHQYLLEQTLGNDNSVAGFSDQSKNVQSTVVVTPTPTSGMHYLKNYQQTKKVFVG